MIFSPSAIKKIKAGKKTATTRVSRYWWDHTHHTIAIQPGRGKHGVGYIRLVSEPKDIRTGELEPHTFLHFREEGFKTSRACAIRFLELKLDEVLMNNGVLWYYEFEYVGEEKPETPRRGRPKELPE